MKYILKTIDDKLPIGKYKGQTIRSLCKNITNNIYDCYGLSKYEYILWMKYKKIMGPTIESDEELIEFYKTIYSYVYTEKYSRFRDKNCLNYDNYDETLEELYWAQKQ